MKGEEKSQSCEVCKKLSHKYKCPNCRLKYCSLSCFKVHKDGICEMETNRKRNEQGERGRTPDGLHISTQERTFEEGELMDHSSESGSDDEDTVSPQALEKLGHSKELRNMLCNKHLQDVIREIDSSQNPETLLKDAMQIPIFTEFVDECLRIVEPQDEQQMECL